ARPGGGLRYSDAAGAIDLPRPALPGPHQPDNAGIAIAALRAWNPPWLSNVAIVEGLARAEWPARLQRLTGRLAATLLAGWELWLDGGHNPSAGEALAAHVAEAWGDRPLHILVGMKRGKGADGFLRPLVPLAASLTAVADPGQHLAMPVPEIITASGGAARPGGTVAEGLAAVTAGGGPPARVLICGSLYLAGEMLKADGAAPA
ncbi:MAG: bifunctional folylpolyglutamate synthase/dihydrofolate synthase, partial [Acetobacteraceae bacterium]|nr:bifunctional folylpolyglutamate synthase/dihydrofolate synthase [Acetobacteraceae bacterium]